MLLLITLMLAVPYITEHLLCFINRSVHFVSKNRIQVKCEVKTEEAEEEEQNTCKQ